MQFKILLAFSFFTLGILCSYAQKMQDQTFSDDIKTVRLYPTSNEIGLPVITLNSNERLVFTFDELGQDSKTYYYKLIHCDQNWEPTIQETYEYIDGFTRATIDDYNFSYNTRVPYVNYKLEIPNLDMNITQSGNYIISVYEDDPSKPILTKRFMVVEKVVGIEQRVVLPRTKSNYRDYQEIIFNVLHPGMNISYPYQEVHASVLQNQRWDNAYTGIKPRFLKNGMMEFDYNGQITFEAGREYRRFDIRSMRFLGMGVRAIQNNDVYLLFDRIRNQERYFIETDYNGQYFIDVIEYRNRNVESDYSNVHFNLPMNAPFTNGQLYVGGIFNNYDATLENQMKWNPVSNMYETEIQLKQGFYDYIYYFTENGKNEKSVIHTEGNDYDAENQYDIFIYYKAFGERYDRIIGHLTFNSRVQ